MVKKNYHKFLPELKENGKGFSDGAIKILIMYSLGNLKDSGL